MRLDFSAGAVQPVINTPNNRVAMCIDFIVVYLIVLIILAVLMVPISDLE
jgi:hypothetical protein